MPPRLTSVLKQRRRLAPAVAVAALLVVGHGLWNSRPRQTEVRVRLGSGHASVVELEVRFVQDGDEMHGLRLAFPEGAPPLVPCRVELGPGRYQIKVELLHRDGKRSRLERALEVPAAAPVRIEAEAGRVTGEKPGPAQRH